MDSDYHLLENKAIQQVGQNEDEECLVNISSSHHTSTSRQDDSCCDISPLFVSVRSSESSEQQDQEKRLEFPRKAFYLLHACTRVSDQIWHLTNIIFLAAFCNFNSLVLVSSFGIVTCLAAQLFGNVAVRLTENASRPGVVLICAKNGCVLIATLLSYFLLYSQIKDGKYSTGWGFKNDFSWIKQVMSNFPQQPGSLGHLIWIYFFGAVAQTLDHAFCISMKDKCIAVMSKTLKDESEKDCDGTASTSSGNLIKYQDAKSWLQETNVALDWIDLSSKALAPALIAFVVGMSRNKLGDPSGERVYPYDRFQLLSSASHLVWWATLCCMIVELKCLSLMSHHVPELASDESSIPETKQPLNRMETNGAANCPVTIFSELSIQLNDYFQQPTSIAGLGLSLLHFNIWAFDGVMIVTMVWTSFRVETSCAIIAVVSAVGLAGLFIFRYSSKRFSQVSICMGGPMFQFLFFSLFFGSIDASSEFWRGAMLIMGAGAARTGLWLTESSVKHLMHEFVPSHVHSSVERAQESLNALCRILSLGLFFVCPDLTQGEFETYAWLSFAAVVIAVIVYAVGILNIANDIFPKKSY